MLRTSKMIFEFKKILFIATINLSLFFILLIGIQNSSNKAKVSFLVNETIELPVSFIIGTSFISGSLLGSLITINFLKER